MRWVLNILVVFIISGLWHGANYTFLFWGLIFAIAYLIENVINQFLQPKKEQSKSFSLKHILLAFKTFVIVTIAWVFFRSENIDDAWSIFGHLFNNMNLGESIDFSLLLGVVLGGFILVDILLYNKRYDVWIGKQHIAIRWSSYFILIFAIICFSGVEDFPFIYFQF